MRLLQLLLLVRVSDEDERKRRQGAVRLACQRDIVHRAASLQATFRRMRVRALPTC